MKQKIQKILRKSGLMRIADYFRYLFDKSKKRSNNNKFRKENPDFVFPPDKLMYEIFGTVDYYHFVRTGKKASNNIAMLYSKYGNKKAEKVMEWGCGVARITRHLHSYTEFSEADIHGIDISKEMIEWNKNNIKNIHFRTNNINPPTDLESKQFDLIYSTSVFTHLSEKLQHEWIEEILRLLKPEGIFIFTVHGDYYANRKLLPEELAVYKTKGIVVRSNVEEGSRILSTFNSPDFIKNKLLIDHTIVDHITEGDLELAGYQDIWVVKK